MKKDIYQSPLIGQEISCVMRGIEKEFLLGVERLKLILKKRLIKENFEIIKFSSHNFIPQGFTLFFLLGESHLAIHTYPEYNSLYFNLYSCRGPNDAEDTFNFLKEKMKPKEILFLKKNEIPVG